MRRLSVSSLALLAIACQTPTPNAANAEAKPEQAEPEPEHAEPEWTPTRREPPSVREDLVATSLPPVPVLDVAEHAVAEAGSLAMPEGSDELAPRAAVAVGGGLLLVGQTYLGRVPGRPSKSWRWLGLVAPGAEPRSTRSEPGAIRAAIAHDGGALVVGASGIGFDTRGWFAIVDQAGAIDFEVTLESPNTTELFDLLPGAAGARSELAVVAGYVDAQGWIVALDRGGMPVWQRYIGSYGYTQIRGLARVDAGLLAVGSRAQTFGEFWLARSPATGEGLLDATGVDQDALAIEGADPNQILRAIVDAGEHGLFALGTAKLNYIQAHDQVVAVALDRQGEVRWSKVVPELRATEVHGGAVRGAGGATFVVSIPGSDDAAPGGLALVELAPEGAITARQLADSTGWTSAGFVEGESPAALVTYMASETGIDWRRSLLPGG